MTTKTIYSGLERAMNICEDRSSRVKELKNLGMKIIGYKDIHPVLEMLTGLDLVPFRLLGKIKECVTEADRFLSNMVCPMLRSVLDQGLKGEYDFLDGSVFSHGCEGSQNLASIWRTCMKDKIKYHYFLESLITINKLYKLIKKVVDLAKPLHYFNKPWIIIIQEAISCIGKWTILRNTLFLKGL